MTQYTFTEWDRSGVAASLTDPDDLVRTSPARGLLNATVSVNWAGGQAVPLHVYGPGDVTALDPRQIVRVYPAPGTPDAEVTYFPVVEFDQSDLPWLFTPLAPGPTGSLRPWLALVCVPAALGLGPHREPGMPLPALLQVPGDELPDPAFLHLWAHAQLIPSHEKDPRRSLSRLLAPRRLLPHTDYVACVVPAFEAGRLAGRGEEGGDLSPAWSRDGHTDLPVYFSWSFTTGEGGDFETLADRLQARPLPAAAGRRPLDVSSPGLFEKGPGELTQQVESALRRPDATPGDPWPVDDGSTHWQSKLAAALQQSVNDDGDEDPDVLPPLYGAFHALRDDLATSDPADWFDSLNLEPRWRVAAGLGTRAVQREQEQLMASAWAQLADVREANRFLDLALLARLVGVRLHTRHVRPLSADEVLHMAAPLQSRAALGATTLRGRLQASTLPNAMISTAFRRATRPFGTLGRRVTLLSGRAAQSPVPFATTVTDVAACGAGLAAVTRDPDGAIAFAVRPEMVVTAERLPAVRAALGLPDASPIHWTDLGAEVIRRAVVREVAASQLAAGPPVPVGVLDDTFRLNAVPEIEVPARFFSQTRLTPQGALLFPSGHSSASGLLSLTQSSSTEGSVTAASFTGELSGPWEITPATEGRTQGSWQGTCTGAWTHGTDAGTWIGTFTGSWENPVDGASTPGAWRAVFTGTWQSATDQGPQGTWQGVAVGTRDGDDVTSDGTFTGTWQSPTAHGSCHGACPGTWDWDHSGSAGTWRTSCTGAWQPSPADSPSPQAPAWATEQHGEILGAWHRDGGIALDKVIHPGRLPEQAGRLPAAPVLGLTPDDVQRMVTSANDTLHKPSDAPEVPARTAFPTAEAHLAVVEVINPAHAVTATVASAVQRPATGDNATPIQWAPSFTDPMWPPLAAQSTEWLLAGLEDVPSDTASVVVTNPQFVEAYMAGLNHEFARELRWREYPTDQRGTYFASFWGTGPEIPPLTEWDALPLGGHLKGPQDRVVLLLRSALLRRYPSTLVYAAPLNGNEPVDAQARHPIFRAGPDPDTHFLGFDLTKAELLASSWCFVIAEQPTEPRFGLDLPDDPLEAQWGKGYEAPAASLHPAADAWNDLSWTHLFDQYQDFAQATYAPGNPRPKVAVDGLVWGAGGAAGIARQCFQQPVRVVMPAARLLNDKGEPG
ncbi:hypothetical protein OG894_42525 (plasmid) [Streptomyces sp. NBC_01724]|uniref:hypothetical protein n=1 Tax=Streptomyces sp. NBC_01724 TaxID=2975922 RepID=UPI002E34701E|nr:hypothetical protein [Streptomyces sp. NBC_01724]